MNAPLLNTKGKITLKLETPPIHEVMLTIGVPPNLLGYSYIVEATELILLEPNYLRQITKCLYGDIAKKFDTTPSRVERAIRHAIQVTWQQGNFEFIDHLFKHCINPDKGMPTNSLFLANLVLYIRTTYKE